MKSIFQIIDGLLSRCSKAIAAHAEKHRYCSIPVLIERTDQKLQIENVDESIADCVLVMICEAFDIDPADKDKIREYDSVKKIYNSLYNDSFGLMDECELERFSGMLERLMKQKIDNSEWKKYDEMSIGEMIALAARIRNNRPVSDPEKEYILSGHLLSNQADIL